MRKHYLDHNDKVIGEIVELRYDAINNTFRFIQAYDGMTYNGKPVLFENSGTPYIEIEDEEHIN